MKRKKQKIETLHSNRAVNLNHRTSSGDAGPKQKFLGQID